MALPWAFVELRYVYSQVWEGEISNLYYGGS